VGARASDHRQRESQEEVLVVRHAVADSRRLPDLARQLKMDVTVAELDQQARAKTDMQAAQQMQQAKHKLFAAIRGDRRA